MITVVLFTTHEHELRARPLSLILSPSPTITALSGHVHGLSEPPTNTIHAHDPHPTRAENDPDLSENALSSSY